MARVSERKEAERGEGRERDRDRQTDRQIEGNRKGLSEKKNIKDLPKNLAKRKTNSLRHSHGCI